MVFTWIEKSLSFPLIILIFSPQTFPHFAASTLETLRQAILSNEFMCQMESDEIGAMIQGMRPMDVQAETTIVRQGELSSELFVLQGLFVMRFWVNMNE